ncbi:hypothetical protein AJ80_09603 [Polytolypa hystricis UAMH7299]|uniref:Uncharacterized protein n=1 Tax=Polytolypa hystricis (strain UAMH7299) TaxID=1447883 RepID=A0A2B7WNA7_POLH7|nr:hypothetical protein AJ80_09603 [Polytolypa hystricis UAMH7299]
MEAVRPNIMKHTMSLTYLGPQDPGEMEDDPGQTAKVRWSSPAYSNTISYVANCSMRQKYVEVAVICAGGSGLDTTRRTDCAATAIRESQQHQPSNKPSLLYPDLTTFEMFEQSLRNATPKLHFLSHSMLDEYMNGPENFINSLNLATLTAVPPATFSERLAHMVNAYYIARLGFEFLTLGPTASSPNGSGNDSALDGQLDTSSIATTSGTLIQDDDNPTCSINRPWLTAFVLCILSIVVSSIVTPVLALKSLNPDILGYISTFTRDNPNFEFPAPASALGGIERARWAMSEVVIRMWACWALGQRLQQPFLYLGGFINDIISHGWSGMATRHVTSLAEVITSNPLQIPIQQQAKPGPRQPIQRTLHIYVRRTHSIHKRK